MRNNKTKSLALILTLVPVMTLFGGFPQKGFDQQMLDQGLPAINAVDEKDILPGCFRMSRVLRLPVQSKVNLKGLEALNISGSSQFSELSFETILKKVGRSHITVVDLRQEDGGFLVPLEGKGAIPFSYVMSMPWWTGENPRGNRTVEEIERSETEKMARIKPKSTFTIYGDIDGYAPSDTHDILYKVDIVAKRALTEKQLMKEKNQSYYRLPDRKFGHMEFEHVDAFVEFVKQLPPGEWVHFHCKKGQSRTTLFMTMYDMMRNADSVSADDIIRRQGPEGLGGANLLKLPSTKDWDYTFKKGWLMFLYHFHSYAKENKATHFQKSFSTWAKENGIEQPAKLLVGNYYKKTTAKSRLPVDLDVCRGGETLILNTINESKQTLSNFRSTQDLWIDPSKKTNFAGLNSYFASGSSQYSKVGLTLFLDRVKKLGKNVIVVDLRHDDHLFVNGMNVSSFETKDALQKPREASAIIQSENALKAKILKQRGVVIHAIDTRYPKNDFDNRLTLVVKPEKVETPEELVRSLGAEYCLIGCKRFSESSDEDIDHFVSIVRSHPVDTWFHFHCKKGKSRTTFFMILLDMMHNADRVSKEEIIARQFEIGGSNLLDITPKDPFWPEEKESKKQWIECLARFHRYCAENKASNFAKSWREWSSENDAYRPSVDHLVFDRNEEGK